MTTATRREILMTQLVPEGTRQKDGSVMRIRLGLNWATYRVKAGPNVFAWENPYETLRRVTLHGDNTPIAVVIGSRTYKVTTAS